jgi:septal ring factor EnvC (AmiA/AmiB activator)
MLLDETVIACVPRPADPSDNPAFDEVEARYGKDPDQLVGALACCERALAVTNDEHRRLKQVHSRMRSTLRRLRETYIAALDEILSLRSSNAELKQKLHATQIQLDMARSEIEQSDRDYAQVVRRCETFENRLAMLTETVLQTMPDAIVHPEEPPPSPSSALPMERLFDASPRLTLVS